MFFFHWGTASTLEQNALGPAMDFTACRTAFEQGWGLDFQPTSPTESNVALERLAAMVEGSNPRVVDDGQDPPGECGFGF